MIVMRHGGERDGGGQEGKGDVRRLSACWADHSHVTHRVPVILPPPFVPLCALP